MHAFARRIVIIQRKITFRLLNFLLFTAVSLLNSYHLHCYIFPPIHIFARTLFSFRVLLLSSDHVHVIIFSQVVVLGIGNEIKMDVNI